MTLIHVMAAYVALSVPASLFCGLFIKGGMRS